MPIFLQCCFAQDTRTVIEPKLPAVCSHLKAMLHSQGRSLRPTDEARLDTARIQQAVDHCTLGHAVALEPGPSGDAFLSGPLALRTGVTLLVAKGATLFASRDPALYAVAPGTCGVVNQAPAGCRPLISIDHAAGAAIMGDGIIDGRGGEKLLGRDVTWWQLAEQARPNGRQQVPRLIIASHADDLTLYRITLRNSANFHVVDNHSDGLTVWGIKIDTPQRGARNTDGIDPGGTKNITITHSFIRAGDDDIALKAGDGAIENVTISHNHFYWGHGMSIGSETSGGVSRVRVTDLSIDGADNGLRIKSNASRGGLVHDVVYDDICIRNSPNPVFLDSAYTAAGSLVGTSYPTFRDITLHNVRISGGGKFSFEGYSAEHRVGLNLDGVVTTDAAKYTYSVAHADFHLGPGAVNLKLAGADSTVTGTAGPSAAPSCADAFVPFPPQ